jgi:hypothetical protein
VATSIIVMATSIIVMATSIIVMATSIIVMATTIIKIFVGGGPKFSCFYSSLQIFTLFLYELTKS